LDKVDADKMRNILEAEDPTIKSGKTSVASYLHYLRDKKVNIYTDEPGQVLAVVTQDPGNPDAPAVLEKFVTNKTAALNNVPDNLWTNIKKDHPALSWEITKEEEDGNLDKSWHFERADGSLRNSHTGKTLFFYGIEGAEKVKKTFDGFSGKRSFSTMVQRRSYSTNTRKNVGLIGARGYTGRELINLIDQHPNLNLTHVSSRELEGKPLEGYNKEKLTYVNLKPEDIKEHDHVDAWVLALPNGVCHPFVRQIEQDVKDGKQREKSLVDLSADYRFEDTWTYGLPEFNREKLAGATRIANPGCYATGAQMSIKPLLPFLASSPTVFGVSGYSGAGTKPSNKNDPAFLKDNIVPYALTGHIHEKEVSSQLGYPVHFIPHVAPWFQGIALTVNIPLNKSMSSRDVKDVFSEFYQNEKLVKIIEGEPPLVRDNAGKHSVSIGGFGVQADGKRAVICTTIDNLLKGAATQAVQNLNLSLGFDEYAGIPTQ
jgi:N-acetyl-gamma-glutamyl-phosphate reductase/acetylglutamate kinase